MALLREPIANYSAPLFHFLQTPPEIDLDNAPHDLLTRALETCLSQRDTQTSLADLTRLIQLLEAHQTSTQPTHLEVRWVDPPEFEEPTT